MWLSSPLFTTSFDFGRLHCVGRVVGNYIESYQVRRERIFINVPPATVRHLRFKPVPVAAVASEARSLALSPSTYPRLQDATSFTSAVRL